MKLLAILINFRTPELTLRALDAALRELESIPSSRLVLIDNDSRDGSFEKLAAGLAERGVEARVDLVAAPRNGGFAYGVNFGVRHGLGFADPPQYFYLLNSDATPEPGAIAHLLAFLERRPDVGIAGSYIYGTDGAPHETAFRFHNLTSELVAMIRGVPLIARWLDRRLVAMPIPTEDTRVDWLAGASMLIRAEVFRDTGFFDERFFLYYEETDFCRRALAHGWPTWYLPGSRVEHVGSASTGQKDWSRPRTPHWFRSRRYYWYKTHGRAALWAANLLWLAGYALGRAKAFVLRRPYPEPPSLLRDFLRYNFTLAPIGPLIASGTPEDAAPRPH